MTNKSITHIITILWGTVYKDEDVNRLFSMIQRNTTKEIRFHLFSNEPLPNLDSRITHHPEPELNVGFDHSKYNYRKTVGLCEDNLAELKGQRVFFFDLDVLIMDNLDDLFDYPKGEQFYIINDWNSKGKTVGQATCYSFVVGTLGYIRSHFIKNAEKVIDQFGTATQQYLSSQIIHKEGSLTFWPDQWFQSFRFHCLPFFLFRHYQVPKKPKATTKVLAFHGHPDIRDALAGRWSPPNLKKSARGWKKIYKACKQTPWINDYWY